MDVRRKKMPGPKTALHFYILPIRDHSCPFVISLPAPPGMKTIAHFSEAALDTALDARKNIAASGLRTALEKASKLDPPVRPATLFLAENLRETDSDASFQKFSEAADFGDLSAITMKGLMLANGIGCKADIAAAVPLLQKAAEDPKGIRAKAALADLYLQGADVLKKTYGKELGEERIKNEMDKKAVALLTEASEGKDRRAKDQLGTCFDKGIGTGGKNPAKARELYEEAAKLGYYHSLGNLAILYIMNKVDSEPAPLKKAVVLLKQGIDAKDDFCLYLYARCLESGTGVKANMALATEKYSEAAEAGNLEAQKWCNEHGVKNRKGEPFKLERKVILTP